MDAIGKKNHLEHSEKLPKNVELEKENTAMHKGNHEKLLKHKYLDVIQDG